MKIYRLNADYSTTEVEFSPLEPCQVGLPLEKTSIRGRLVSTVFLAVNHAWMGGPPMLFETMIFDGENDSMRRYSTWAEAMAGHEEMVAQFVLELNAADDVQRLVHRAVAALGNKD